MLTSKRTDIRQEQHWYNVCGCDQKSGYPLHYFQTAFFLNPKRLGIISTCLIKVCLDQYQQPIPSILSCRMSIVAASFGTPCNAFSVVVHRFRNRSVSESEASFQSKSFPHDSIPNDFFLRLNRFFFSFSFGCSAGPVTAPSL